MIKSQCDFGFKTPPRKRERKVKRGRRKKDGAGVSHARRQVDERHPLHVTLKMKRHVWQLRSRRCFRVLERAFFEGCRKFGSRLCHFSVQHDHVHLLVESKDPVALARALQGLAIRMARGLNRVMGRRGGVFADRYHARSLKTPTEVRRALVYVLGNARKHLVSIGQRPKPGWIDPCSSAVWFQGWASPPDMHRVPPPDRVAVTPPGTWLLQAGYLRAGGPIRIDEAPKGI
jgi:REP-associated tyrosine transposase